MGEMYVLGGPGRGLWGGMCVLSGTGRDRWVRNVLFTGVRGGDIEEEWML